MAVNYVGLLVEKEVIAIVVSRKKKKKKQNVYRDLARLNSIICRLNCSFYRIRKNGSQTCVVVFFICRLSKLKRDSSRTCVVTILFVCMP